jgi:hypothetical protein
MDTDKIKVMLQILWKKEIELNNYCHWLQVFGSRIRVDSVAKVAELELAEKEKMKEKVEHIMKHNCNVFVNRLVCSIFYYFFYFFIFFVKLF